MRETESRRWKLFAILVVGLLLLAPATATAQHRWGDLSWATTDGVVELYADTTALGRAWNTYSSEVLSDWDASGHVVLDRIPQGKQGAVRVRSGNFGPSGWLGIAVVWINDADHIVASAVSLTTGTGPATLATTRSNAGSCTARKSVTSSASSTNASPGTRA